MHDFYPSLGYRQCRPSFEMRKETIRERGQTHTTSNQRPTSRALRLAHSRLLPPHSVAASCRGLHAEVAVLANQECFFAMAPLASSRENERSISAASPRAKTCSFSCPKACTSNAAVRCSSSSRANLFKPKTKPSSARIVIWPKPNKTARRMAIWPTILHGMLRQELGRSAIGRRCSPTERWCRLLTGAGEEARRFWMPISSSSRKSTRALSPTRLRGSSMSGSKNNERQLIALVRTAFSLVKRKRGGNVRD